jgi:hypothetical protein
MGIISFNGGGMTGFPKHPQYDILKKHIERSIQDIFLNSLRDKMEDLVYVFDSQDQIDSFIKRMLKYWEGIENYETCMEIKNLVIPLKNKWENRGMLEPREASVKIKDIFKSTLNNNGSL